MGLSISRMDDDFKASMDQARKAVADLRNAPAGASITGEGAEGRLRIQVTAGRRASVRIKKSLVSDAYLRDLLEQAIEEAVTKAFLAPEAIDPAAEAVLADFAQSNDRLLGDLQADLGNQLRQIDDYFEGFKARVRASASPVQPRPDQPGDAS